MLWYNTHCHCKSIWQCHLFPTLTCSGSPNNDVIIRRQPWKERSDWVRNRGTLDLLLLNVQNSLWGSILSVWLVSRIFEINIPPPPLSVPSLHTYQGNEIKIAWKSVSFQQNSRLFSTSTDATKTSTFWCSTNNNHVYLWRELRFGSMPRLKLGRIFISFFSSTHSEFI